MVMARIRVVWIEIADFDGPSEERRHVEVSGETLETSMRLVRDKYFGLDVWLDLAGPTENDETALV